jgi:serine kinase of HPr protein (carbohydrate metabolism regulator)
MAAYRPMSMPAAIPESETAAEASPGPYIHATALAIGEAGLLIRGRSGSGKSRLALDLLAEASRRGLFVRLVGDDRVAIAAHGGRLVARGHPAIPGQIENRGEGIIELGHEPATVIRLVVDLGAGTGAPARLPLARPRVSVCEIELPQLRLEAPGPRQAGIVLDYLLRMGDA